MSIQVKLYFLGRRNIFVIFAIIVAIFFCIISFLRQKKNFKTVSSQETETKVTNNEGVDEETLLKVYWTKKIRDIGSDQAYIELKGSHNQYNKSQHLAAHIFGEILYREKGIEGLQVCDDIYAYGCYHGFFRIAISEKGLGIIEIANKVCVQKGGAKETGCRHGIGHGILEHLGSLSNDQLAKALDLCKTIQEPSLLGCTQGVFMEYNFPVTEEIQRREFNTSDPFTPCDAVATIYRSSCYFELGEWWIGNEDRSFQLLRNHCNEFIDQEVTHACLLGIGRAIAQSTSYNFSLAYDQCIHFNSSRDEIFCLGGASWTFQAVGQIDDSDKLCIEKKCKEAKNVIQ